MTSPADVAAFHREFDRHPDDRVRLFAAVRELVPGGADAAVLYPGSYVDIGPSVWFDDVTYVDLDKRAARFFATTGQVADLVAAKRAAVGRRQGDPTGIAFHHADYADELPIEDGSIDLLVSLYAGFISEHCTRYVRPGGLLVANNSHGDASMASLDPANELVAVVRSVDGGYRATTADPDRDLRPKRGHHPTVDELHQLGRGIAYTRPAFAYVFRRSDGPGARS